jgi:hypothetical protein
MENSNTTQVSHEIRREDYDHVPFFDGNPSELLHFITTVEDIYNKVCHDTVKERVANNRHLVNKIKARLTGSALSLLLSKNITTIKEIVEMLKRNFADSRTYESCIYEYEREIYESRLMFKENPIDYLNR